MYEIEISTDAAAEINALRAFERARVRQEIELLLHEAETEGRNRKRLDVRQDLPWAAPVWEIRVGEIRVFYRIDQGRVAIVLAVRKKGRKQTKEIL